MSLSALLLRLKVQHACRSLLKLIRHYACCLPFAMPPSRRAAESAPRRPFALLQHLSWVQPSCVAKGVMFARGSD